MLVRMEGTNIMQTKTGVSASSGIAIGRAIILDLETFPIPQRHIDPDLAFIAARWPHLHDSTRARIMTILQEGFDVDAY